MGSIEKVVIVGTGNVANLMGLALQNAGIPILQVYGRTKEKAESLANVLGAAAITDISEIDSDAHLVMLCISDSAIIEVLDKIENKSIPIIHTSGAVSLDVFGDKFKHFGVFYPLQTFTKGVTIDFKEIPICIVSPEEDFANELKSLGEKLSGKVTILQDEERAKLHIAAVMVNNFTNHLFALAEDYCQKNQLDFELLRPLIKATFEKIRSFPAKDMQTGPAIRGDEETIAKHLALLNETSDKALKDIYTLLTKSIVNFYRK